MYRGGRPGLLARWWNRLDAAVYRTGLFLPDRAAELQVRGRTSGRIVRLPVAVADVGDAEYLVSMLGPGANWVRNVEAAGGRAVLSRRRRDVPIRLVDVPVAERAPILRRYAAIAPGARPHLGAGPHDDLARFERIAPAHPVYRVVDAR